MGSSQSRDQINTTLYKWSSEEFHEEYALIYSSCGRFLSSRSCTFYYRVNPNKVTFTIDDCLHLANRVRVNMQFEAIRDNKGLFKLGSVKLKESDAVFNEQRRGATKSQVLYLNYCDYRDHRFNQLGLYRINKEEYEAIFHTGISTDDYITHTISIHCDPSKGFDVNLSGPYRYYSGEKDLCDTHLLSGLPPDDVIKNAQIIRKELKPKAVETKRTNNNVGVSGGPQQHNTVVTTGSVRGNFNGSIIHKSTFNIYEGGQHKKNNLHR